MERDENGIPCEAIQNTDTHIWLTCPSTGTVYKRKHGRKSTYSAGCHCIPCYKANKEAELRYLQRVKGTGGKAKRYDGNEVRAHILWLAAEKNIGRRALSKMTGIHEASIQRVLRGKQGNPPPKTVMPRIAEKILAIRGDEEIRPAHCSINSDLTIRRVRSLHALGYSGTFIHKLMKDRLDMEINGASNRVNKLISSPELHPRVWVCLAEEVRRVYQMVGDTPAEDMGASKSAAGYSRNNARRHGWDVPASWDDPGTLFGEPETEASELEPEVDWVVVERLAKGDRPERFSHDERAAALALMIKREVSHNEIRDRLKLSFATYNSICDEHGIDGYDKELSDERRRAYRVG